jgi:hypothetical protein
VEAAVGSISISVFTGLVSVFAATLGLVLASPLGAAFGFAALAFGAFFAVVFVAALALALASASVRDALPPALVAASAAPLLAARDECAPFAGDGVLPAGTVLARALTAGFAAVFCLASALAGPFAAAFGLAAAFGAGVAAAFGGAFFAAGLAGFAASFAEDLTLGRVTALGADFGGAFGFALTAGAFPFALDDAFETALDATLVAIWLCAP